MHLEIERKFLVRSDEWRHGQTGTLYRQGYLSTDPGRTVRVRRAGGRAWLTIKGLTEGISRTEFEFEIPAEDAEELLQTLCLQPVIEKTRYVVSHRGRTWEVDVFSGANEGLVLAEVELNNENDVVDLPAWVGDEVSGDPRYYNASLVDDPYAGWS